MHPPVGPALYENAAGRAGSARRGRWRGSRPYRQPVLVVLFFFLCVSFFCVFFVFFGLFVFCLFCGLFCCCFFGFFGFFCVFFLCVVLLFVWVFLFFYKMLVIFWRACGGFFSSPFGASRFLGGSLQQKGSDLPNYFGNVYGLT